MDIHRLLLVDLLLGFFNERKDVAHAEDAGDDPLRIEDFQLIVLFADTHELDGLAGDVMNGKRRAAAGVAVKLRQDHAGRTQALVEFLGAAHGVLADHGIGNQQDFTGPQLGAQFTDFVHQFLVDVQAAGGVNNQHVVAAVGGVLARGHGQLEWGS